MIIDKIEYQRGCGFRKPGGYYLVSKHMTTGCGLLPIPISVCPCCGEGPRFSRAPRWIEGRMLMSKDNFCKDDITFEEWLDVNSMTGWDLRSSCESCVVRNIRANQKVLLLWIGGGHYKTADAFMKEARSQGISRKIPAIPRGFKLGETVVALAHKKAIDGKDPGVFAIFKPAAIERIHGGEDEETMKREADRGVTWINPIRKPVEDLLSYSDGLSKYEGDHDGGPGLDELWITG